MKVPNTTKHEINEFKKAILNGAKVGVYIGTAVVIYNLASKLSK